MGTRNRGFVSENEDVTSRNDIDEVSTISKNSLTDGAQISRLAEKVGGMNLNDYATRKTLAQGMLDLALLTANAAQLKRILTLGDDNRFYYFLLTLISISICLQVFQAIIMCILAIVFDLNNIDQHKRTNIANNVLLMVTIVSVSINIIISTFDIADIK